MRYLPPPPRLRLTAGGVLLLSAGIILGSFTPRGTRAEGRPAAPRGARGTPGAATSAVTPAAAPAAAPAQTGELDPGRDSAASTPELALGPPPAFGGRYAVLRGATTAGPVGGAAGRTEFPRAPESPVDGDAASSPAEGPEPAALPAAAPAPASPGVRPERREAFRPAPADAIPRGVAADYPLLALFEGGGRVVFHDLGEHPGVVPTSVEGTWAEVGHCGRTVRADLSLPTEARGELRAIGRGSAADAGHAALVVARQGCDLASSRFALPQRPDADDRRQFAGMEPAGFTAGDLAQVVRSGPVRLALYRSAAGQAAVAVEVTRLRAAPLWSFVLTPADGDLSAIGVSRRGSSTRVWLLVRTGTRAAALVAAAGPDGAAWPAGSRIELAPR